MHAAKDNVVAASTGSFLRKLVRVAAKICEADDLVPLIVMAEKDDLTTQNFPGRADALVHGVVGKDEIVLQTANGSSGAHVVTRFQLQISRDKTAFRQLPLGTGMLKAHSGSSRLAARY